VRLGRTDGLATGAAVTIGTSGTGTFDLTGFSQTVAGIAQGAGAAVIGNSSTTQDAVLTLTGNSTYDGTIRDALGGGSRRVLLAVNGGNLRLTGANTFSGTSSVAAGTLQVGHAAALAASPAAVLSGGTLTVDAGLSMQTPSLTIAAGGLARLPSSAATTLATSWLAIDGRLDVGVGRLEIAAGGITEDSLLAALVAGRGDGTWTGTTGITSSSAAVDLAGGIPRSVGWIADGDASFSAAYTAPGDANVDGQVDILDAANFISGGLFDNWQPAVWSQGDFNYDGVVDILDALDFFNTGLYDTGVYNPPAGAAGAVAAVPEPAGSAGAVIAAVILLLRQRAWRRFPAD
jgi:autotransporter-associated beta strand protein